MIRERVLNSVSFTEGAVSLVDLPRDSVYHLIQLNCFNATATSTYTSSGTVPIFAATFPFNIMRSVRLLRNGSDVVWQGSGEQLAKEHFYLNNRFPKARIYTVSSNVETLLTGSSRGITLPAVSDVIGSNLVEFAFADTTNKAYLFDFQVEMWMQMGMTGGSDSQMMTLVDARPLATFQLEITWNVQANIWIPGTATNLAISATVNILSIDQDSIPVDVAFGTFKRAAQSYTSLAFGTANQQILLPRGNYFHGLILQTQAYKSGSTVIGRAENDCIQTLENRINSNFSLRKVDFRSLQAKNMGNNGGRDNVYDYAEGVPQGWAMLEYTAAGETAGELVDTRSYDQFDLLLTTWPISGTNQPSNGANTSATNPIINILTQEVIPGIDTSASAPRGSQAGSISRTSAKIGGYRG